MSQTYIKSGAVDVRTLRIISAVGGKQPFDLMNQVVEFSIYEDITFPVMRAEFTFIDGVDLLNAFPIIGEEIIEVEFSNPGIDIVNSYRFFVKSVENQNPTQHAKVKSYVVRCVSEEMMTNMSSYVTKRYDMNTDDIIFDILDKQIKTKKKILFGDNTKGIQDILISRQRPFQAIDLIRKRAVSEDYFSSSFVFFENKQGFNFCSIEFLMDNLDKSINDKIFYYDTSANIDATNMNTRGMLSVRNVSQLDNSKKLTQGGLNNIVKRFDILTGKVDTYTYIDSQQESKFAYASNNPKPLNTAPFLNAYGSVAAVSMFVPHNSALPETYIAESLGPKHAYVTKLAQNIYQAFVYGDVALSAGDVIEIRIPSFHGGTQDISDNRLLAGNYLISKIRHMIMNFTSSQKSYHCSMELIRGSYEDNA